MKRWQDQIRILYPDEFKDRMVQNISFVLTEDCNMRCTYCYINKNEKASQMTKEVADQAIDFVLNNPDPAPGVIIDFIGGEPLLCIDLMDYITQQFKVKAFKMGHPWANRYMISMTTNGTLYSSEKFQRYLKKNKNMVSVTITIDGDRDLHDSCRIFPNGSGSYDVVSDNVSLWIKQFPDAATKVTFAPENIKYLSNSVIHLYKLGIKNINANPVYEEVWVDNDSKIYYNELVRLVDILIEEGIEDLFFSPLDLTIGKADPGINWCGANTNMLAIGPDGKLYPCMRFMSYSLNNHAAQSIGDIQSGYSNTKFRNELMGITFESQSPQKCLECKVSMGCGWCTAYNYDCYGTPNKRSTAICKLHKARVLANEYYLRKRGIVHESALSEEERGFYEDNYNS